MYYRRSSYGALQVQPLADNKLIFDASACLSRHHQCADHDPLELCDIVYFTQTREALDVLCSRLHNAIAGNRCRNSRPSTDLAHVTVLHNWGIEKSSSMVGCSVEDICCMYVTTLLQVS